MEQVVHEKPTSFKCASDDHNEKKEVVSYDLSLECRWVGCVSVVDLLANRFHSSIETTSSPASHRVEETKEQRALLASAPLGPFAPNQ